MLFNLARRGAPLCSGAKLLARPSPLAHPASWSLCRRVSTAAAPPPSTQTDAEWEKAFLEATADVSGGRSHADSAAAMRTLLRTGLLRNTDLRDRPDRFFKAHRLLARHAVAHGPGARP